MNKINWYYENKKVKIKEDRVVIKLYQQDTFKDSCVIPTVYYPLNNNPEVFTAEDVEVVTDEKILEIFDRIEFKIGRCYDNTDRLVKELRKEGYDAKSYVGWLFSGEDQYPVHHCWCVLDNHILDLSDNYTMMLTGPNGDNFKNAKTKEEQIMVMADFLKAAKNEKNSVVCYPVGKPSPFMFYIGCECDANEGRKIYRQLMQQFPDHKVDRTDKQGLNHTQRKLKEEGLM